MYIILQALYNELKFIITTLEEEEYIGFINYSDGEKPYGFCVFYTGALFYKGIKVRYARESIMEINCIITRHNRYTFYNVYTSLKLWQGLNKNY